MINPVLALTAITALLMLAGLSAFKSQQPETAKGGRVFLRITAHFATATMVMALLEALATSHPGYWGLATVMGLLIVFVNVWADF